MNRSVALFFAVVLAGVVSVTNSNAAVVFTIVDNMDYNGTGGTFSIQLSGDEPISAFDLQLRFDTYTGANQAGGTLTINSENTFNGASKGSFAGDQPLSTVTTDPSNLQRNSFQWIKNLDATPTTFATYSYTGNGGLFPVDNFFTVTVLPNNGTTNDGVGTELQFFNPNTLMFEIIPDSRITFDSQVIGRPSAVPEPGTMAACGLFFVGVVGSKIRRRKQQRKEAVV